MNRTKLLGLVVGLTLVILFVGGCGGTSITTSVTEAPAGASTSEPSTVTPVPPMTELPSTTANPALGVEIPVKDSNWEVTLKAAHEKSGLRASNGSSYSPKDSYTFLVIDVVFRNLDSAQETEFREDEVAVISMDGESFAAVGNSDFGSSWTATGTTYSLEGTTTFLFTEMKEQQLGLVFTVKKDIIDETFQLKFKDLPPITFTVDSE